MCCICALLLLSYCTSIGQLLCYTISAGFMQKCTSRWQAHVPSKSTCSNFKLEIYPRFRKVEGESRSFMLHSSASRATDRISMAVGFAKSLNVKYNT